MDELRVIDFFCGAGGFSEGFRQQGFNIIKGIDNWSPAVETHNLNHGLHDKVMNVLDFNGEKGLEVKGLDAIDRLEDSEIIIGSPPCVNFSMSNRAGKADKSLGIQLIEAYLRVVAVKKHKKGSVLKAWLMENVPNSRNFVEKSYSFKALDLEAWADENELDPDSEALKVKDSGSLLIASDFGSPQSRQRFVCGEIVATGKFPFPSTTHGKSDQYYPRIYPSLGDIKEKMPSPIEPEPVRDVIDPNYPSLKLRTNELTDQFYDTGLYQVEWEMARFFKINHPFMGRMSFPEDESKPSRTIMATRSASTREAIIFRSEYEQRRGDGEYRLPTIREIATLMGFPYTYQFSGKSDGTKWRLIGNAVCPHISNALAGAIREELGLQPVSMEEVDFSEQMNNFKKVYDLRNSIPRSFDKPPKKNKGAKFRMHPFKSGNMTVTLTNYDPNKESSSSTNGKKWYCNIFFGTGKEFKIEEITPELIDKVGERIELLPNGLKFMKEFDKKFIDRIGSFQDLQCLWERNVTTKGELIAPITLVEEVAQLIEGYDPTNLVMDVRLDGIRKERFPLRQLFAIWALGRSTLQAKALSSKSERW